MGNFNEQIDIAGQFLIDGSVVSIEPYGSGHINSTFLITTEQKNTYFKR